MSTTFEWPSHKEWKKLRPGERLILAAHLVKEANERAFEKRLGLSSNEDVALGYLTSALDALGYEIHVSTRHAFRLRQSKVAP
jgi:hypothetical protein